MAPKKKIQRHKKTYKGFVDEIVTYLKRHFYLHAWYIKVVYEKKDTETSRHCFKDDRVIASMGSDATYMNAILHLYPFANKLWEEGNYQYLGECLVHEFAHILTDPLYKWACEGSSSLTGPCLEEARENTTQQVAVIILHGIDKRIFSPYKYIKR